MQARDFTVLTFQTILFPFSQSQLSKSGFFLLLAKCSFLSCHPIPRSSEPIKYILSTKPSLPLLQFLLANKQKTLKTNFGFHLLSLSLIGCCHIISSHCWQTRKSCSLFCCSLKWRQDHLITS